MKKLLAVVVAAILVLGVSVTAFAENYSFGSQSNAVEVSGDGITVGNSTILLTKEKAAELIGGGATPAQISIPLNGKDITAATTPVKLTFTVNGTAAPQKIYVFHYVNDAWMIEGSGDPKTVTVEVASTSPFAVVVYSPAGAGKTSPKTGETNTVAVALAVVLAAGAVAFVLAPKKRA